MRMTDWYVPLLTRYAAQRAARFVDRTRDPFATQERFLKGMLRHYRRTERGKRYRIGEIRSAEEFCDRLPVTQYRDYESDIQRTGAGERNVLTPDPIRFITLTSGTTGQRKWIPVSPRFQTALQKSNIVSIGFLVEALKARGLSLGKALVTNSANVAGKTEGGIELGLASTGSIRMSKQLAAPLFAQPYDLLQISDSRTRHYLCLLYGLRNRNLQSMASNFPMLLLRTCRYLEENAAALIQDLKAGTLSQTLDLTPACRAELTRHWTAHPQRAMELEQLLNRHGRLTPQWAWPHLAFVSTARGGTSDFYFQRFGEYFGQTPVFGGVYGCSEATFGIAHALNEDGCILALESGFYEFIPESEWEAEHPKTLMATDVKIGSRYRILVTNDAGFYRYDIRDVVEVVGFYEKTPLIAFRYRLGGLLNSTSEKTTEFHVIQVMQRLQQEFRIGLEDFCVTLSEREIPAHYWVNLELSADSSLDRPEALLQRFDEVLQEENGHYQIMRRDQVPSPGLRILERGSFETVRHRLLKQGRGENQLKIPHISEDRALLANLKIAREVSWPQA
ncbi:GH3 auxin-responsive promoter family protein [Altericista sp. CCNU0014]|uniref:GH3 auxin-responsive promoter family protein n=1 Tax=Altericista sp. CCNU0014 TaxID=3082949 RepID=UPI00384C9710